MLPTEAEIARIRAQVAGLLPDTCTIQRMTSSVDDRGNAIEAWADVATVACRLDPLPAPVSVLAEQEKQRERFRLTVPHNADLRAGDRVIVGGEPYELIELFAGHSLRAVRRAVVVRFQGG